MSDPVEVRVNGRIEKRSFLKDPLIPNSKEIIDRLGENLANIFTLKHKQMSLFRELWKVYLADCKRLGISPREANTSVM